MSLALLPAKWFQLATEVAVAGLPWVVFWLGRAARGLRGRHIPVLGDGWDLGAASAPAGVALQPGVLGRDLSAVYSSGGILAAGVMENWAPLLGRSTEDMWLLSCSVAKLWGGEGCPGHPGDLPLQSHLSLLL